MKKQIKTLSLSVCLGIIPWVSEAASLRDLDWLAGQWQGKSQGLKVEAFYTGSEGGKILGQTKMFSPQKVEFFEFETFEEKNGSLVLNPLPFGQPGKEFSLKEISNQRVVFENPQNDYPTRIIYELKTSGELIGRIEGSQNGQATAEEFLFTKIK